MRKTFLVICVLALVSPLSALVFVDATEALKIVKELVPDKPVILEAGAHYGEHTRVLSKTWPNGHIHAFEPYPRAYKKLVNATKDLKNVTCYQMALYDYNGTVKFNIAAGIDAASSILKPGVEQTRRFYGPEIEVPCKTLEQWQEDNDIDHIDFFWLDMEGVELPVLRHCPKLLEKTKAMYIEVNFKELRQDMTQFRDIDSFLKNQGFIESFWHPYQWHQADVLYTRKEVW